MRALAISCCIVAIGSTVAVKTIRGAEPDADAPTQAAIEKSIASYVAAYNRGDAKAVAAHWSDSGEWLSPDGQRASGAKAIESAMREFFAGDQKPRLQVSNVHVRLVSADVAVEDGTALVSLPGQEPSVSTYVAIHVKRDDVWKLDSVRETEMPQATSEPEPAEQLQELAWMVGDWADAEAGAANESSVRWTKNNTFLNCSFHIGAPGEDDLEGTIVIGWDSAEKAIRSWLFDSDGGFGQGSWSRRGNLWIVKFRQTLADGSTASATNIYRYIDANTYSWTSMGRYVDGKFAPNVDVKMVRKQSKHSESQKPVAASTP